MSDRSFAASRKPRHDASAAAEHIAFQASNLARLASENGFPMLAYLIDMAVLEAWREACERQVVCELDASASAIRELVG